MDFLKLIQSGESKKVEFKERLTSHEQISKTICAFANSGGGILLIGIKDKNSKIVGLVGAEAIELPPRINNIVFDTISPTPSYDISVIPINKTNILCVEVYSGNLTPYFIKSLGKSAGTFVRVGASTRKADNELIQELERQKSNISYDEEMTSDFSLKDLDLAEIKKYFEANTGKSLQNKDFLNMKILKKAGAKTFPTRGGVLLCGKTELHANCYSSCAAFKGITTNEFIDKKDFHGSLYLQTESIMAFLKTHLLLSGKLKGLQRVDSYEVPLVALREAVINAIVHRDYSLTGSNIKVAIFDDVIEITSPGALLKSLDLDEIISGRSEIRNKVIARFFKEINYIEQWGTGFQKIINSCKEANLPVPQFKESGLFFQVKIFRKKANSRNEQLTEQENLIISFLSKNSTVRNSEAKAILKVSPTRVREVLVKMVAKGILEASGLGKLRVYKVK